MILAALLVTMALPQPLGPAVEPATPVALYRQCKAYDPNCAAYLASVAPDVEACGHLFSAQTAGRYFVTMLPGHPARQTMSTRDAAMATIHDLVGCTDADLRRIAHRP